MKKQNKTALIYVRAASHEMEQPEASIQEQAEACRKYCKSKGMDAAIEITELGSGSAMDNPGFTGQIKQAIKNRPDIGAIVTHDVTRISRKPAVINKFMNQLEKLDVGLYLVKESLLTKLTLSFAETESKALSDRIKAGIKRKKMEQEKNRVVKFTAKGRNGKKYKCQTTMVKPTITRQIN